jgi:hypothetical protein
MISFCVLKMDIYLAIHTANPKTSPRSCKKTSRTTLAKYMDELVAAKILTRKGREKKFTI